MLHSQMQTFHLTLSVFSFHHENFYLNQFESVKVKWMRASECDIVSGFGLIHRGTLSSNSTTLCLLICRE